MKILLVMDPGILVPPRGYGGIERMVEILAKEYLRTGHEVHLLATAGSTVEGCTMHPFGIEGFPPKRSDALRAIPVAWKFLYARRDDFDLIHNFGRLAYLLPVMRCRVKKIMSYQREISKRNIRLTNIINAKNIVFTACSGNLLSRLHSRGAWEVVHNAVDFSKYTLTENLPVDAPLIFLGRIERVKGCHTAIKVARDLGETLIIAGNISPLEEEKEYYETEIEPFIDGTQIRYVGALDDIEKNNWLGRAKALLFPIEWNEPFGIVMIESLACGTPVIAFNQGAVSEVIDENSTGFKVHSLNEMKAAVKKITKISRNFCRQQAMSRFNVSIMAKRYLGVINNGLRKIVILSTHQPAANPRALKEYETLKAMGHPVTHIYAYNADWSYRIDQQKFEKGILPPHDFVEAGGNPHYLPFRYFISRVLHRIFKKGSDVVPFFKKMSTARSAFALWKLAVKYPADLYIAHYLGALPAALKAAKKWKAKVIFDAEDFHRGEQSYYLKQVKNVVFVENMLLPQADIITTASPLITKEYSKLYPGSNIKTINNFFSKGFLRSSLPAPGEGLKLFWFSQHIGRHRGLEIFIQALNELGGVDISLSIMGNCRSEAYRQELLSIAHYPQKIIFRETVFPEDVFAIAAAYDIGLAGEIPNCYNKNICLSNKIFTYLMAGNCILASDMQGQQEFIEKYPGIGFIYKHDDAKDLAGRIWMLYNDPALLQKCKENARNLAEKEVNWENERQRWLVLIGQLLDKKNPGLYEPGKKILFQSLEK